MSQMPPPPPPPPPGGYGSPPPPPEGYGYGGPPAGTPPYSVGNAMSYGWAKFQANAGQIVIAGVIVFLGAGVFWLLGTVIQNVIVQGAGNGFLVSIFASAIVSFFSFLAYQVIGAGVIRGALGITEGRAFRFDEVLRTDQLGPVVITSLITSAIVFVGTLLCFLPGIIASFLMSFSLYFVIDKEMAPVDAIKASVELVTNNVGEALVWSLVAFVIVLVGAIACLVGLVAAIPVSIIGTAYTYKALTGQQVAA